MIGRRALESCCLIFLLCATGCATLRDTRVDHQLPPEVPPGVDLSGLRSVQERKDGQNPDIAVAMAMSGGGHRAANFALGVMLALEETRIDVSGHDLLREVDYFSTVSGGGFPVGAYLSERRASLAAGGTTPRVFSLRQALERNKGALLEGLRHDCQSTIFEALVHPRCLGFLDAGDLLQCKLDDYLLGGRAHKDAEPLVMGDFFRRKGDAPVELPYWVANATVYENGARFPFAPNVLAHYGVERVTYDMHPYSLEKDVLRLPMAVAIRASASFPVAFPATTLACAPGADRLNPYLHLLDGGLSDNIGYLSALEMLAQDQAPRKVLIVIDAYKGISHPRSASRRSPAGAESGFRTMTIGLDGHHAQLARELSLMARAMAGDGEPASIVVLGFQQLKPLLEERIVNLERELKQLRRDRARAVIRRLQRELDEITQRRQEELDVAKGTYELYHDACAVETSLRLTRAQQQLLIQAGEEVVDRNRERLQSLLR